jgi:hypothetical protein
LFANVIEFEWYVRSLLAGCNVQIIVSCSLLACLLAGRQA